MNTEIGILVILSVFGAALAQDNMYVGKHIKRYSGIFPRNSGP